MRSLTFPLLFAALPSLTTALRYEPRGNYYYPGNVTYAPGPTAPPIASPTCYTTKYPAICDYGLCESTYSWTEYCGPYGCEPPSTATSYLPPGFTTTVTLCQHCGYEVTTLTLTIPVTAIPEPYPTQVEPPYTYICEDDDHDDYCGNPPHPPSATHGDCAGEYCPPAPTYYPPGCGENEDCIPEIVPTTYCDDGYCGEPSPSPTSTPTTGEPEQPEHCHGAYCPPPEQTYPIHCEGDAYCPPEPTASDAPGCGGAYCPDEPEPNESNSAVPELPTYTGAATAPARNVGRVFAVVAAGVAAVLV